MQFYNMAMRRENGGQLSSRDIALLWIFKMLNKERCQKLRFCMNTESLKPLHPDGGHKEPISAVIE